VKNDGEAVNFLLFSSDSLSAGDHTLVMNITRCDSQAFIFDYITYTPSFSTLSVMPNLSPPSSGTLSTTSSSKPASTSSGNGSSPTGSQVTQNPSSDRSPNGPPTGAVVGGILGGLLLIALIIIVILWRRRRQSRLEQTEAPSMYSSGMSVTSIMIGWI